MSNLQYPFRELISEWNMEGKIEGSQKATIVCQHCGRGFCESYGENLETIRSEGCPADDCPSHWEGQGLPHPEHTKAIYRKDLEPAFVAFWKSKAESNPIDFDKLFDKFIPEWNGIVNNVASLQ